MARDILKVMTALVVVAVGCEDPTGPSAGPVALSTVTFWAYQIQAISAAGAVDALAESRYDMLVIEPTRTDWSSNDKYFDTSSMVSRLKGTAAHDGEHRKLIIAYIDIGQAEDWRWYWTWSKDWPEGEPIPDDWPDFIVGRDPDGWEGNYPVAYWDPSWKDIILYGENQSSEPYGDYISVVDEVVRDGFDGVYLDWVEGFEDPNVIARAQDDGVDPATEMVKFVEEIRDYGRARNPDFVVIQQNGAALCDGHTELFGIIDGIAQEAIWFDGDATDDWNDPDGYDRSVDPTLTGEYLMWLARYKSAGVPVFCCEYALNYAYDAYAYAAAQRLVCYSTRRPLSKLTTTPPPGY